MYSVSTITSKGQVTLPSKVRKRMGVKAGDTVIFEFVDDQLVVRKARDIENFFNTLPPLELSLKKKLEEKIAADTWGNP
jgi:AbrB family looped-hinge helix DNA binding protein